MNQQNQAITPIDDKVKIQDSAYRDIVLGVLRAMGGLFTLVTGREAPKPRDVLRG